MVYYRYENIGYCQIDKNVSCDQIASTKKQAINSTRKKPSTKTTPTPLIPVQPTKPRYTGANHSHYESSVTDKRVYLNVSPLAKIMKNILIELDMF